MSCAGANIFYLYTNTHTRINKVQGFPEIGIGGRRKKIIVITRREMIRLARNDDSTGRPQEINSPVSL
jgi:hypothetical protein